jgi:hypothetical protein
VLEEMLANYQEAASVDSGMTGNGAAIGASWTRLLLDGLNDRTSDPVIFIPFDLTDLGRALPVRVTAMKVAGGSLTLTLEAVSPDEQSTVLSHLKAPYSEGSAPTP